MDEVNPLGFKTLERFKHNEILTFIKEKAAAPSWITRGYLWGSGISFALFLSVLVYEGLQGFWPTVVQCAVLAVAVPLWVVAHEALHGLTYKWIGAKKVHFSMDLKRFVFFTIVYDQVFSFKSLLPVLLAPAIALSILPPLLMMQGFWILGTGLLCFHILSIGGDLYLLNYYRIHSGKALYTMDLISQETLILLKEDLLDKR